MKKLLSFERSSIFLSYLVIFANLLLCLIFVYFKQGRLASIFVILFVFFGILRFWLNLSSKGFKYNISAKSLGVFPNEKLKITVKIENSHFLPISRSYLSIPYTNECFETENKKEVIKLPKLLWYEKAQEEISLLAIRRGIYKTEKWNIFISDELGLSELSLPIGDNLVFAVYPKLINVRSEFFLKNLWNSETGNHGIMEDITVIKSTRDYSVNDNLKHINWRMLARALPLSVNVYEDILPQSVHFILDGESFSGKNPHRIELERALSFIASAINDLIFKNVYVGLSLSEGEEKYNRNIFNSKDISSLLFALSSYNTMPIEFDNTGEYIEHISNFYINEIMDSIHSVGHFYYIAYNTDNFSKVKLLNYLDEGNTTLITFNGEKSFQDFENVAITSLMGGNK